MLAHQPASELLRATRACASGSKKQRARKSRADPAGSGWRRKSGLTRLPRNRSFASINADLLSTHPTNQDYRKRNSRSRRTMTTRTDNSQGGARYIVIEPGTGPKPPKKLKPARKQVAPGQVEKKEPEQTGKEYSKHSSFLSQ